MLKSCVVFFTAFAFCFPSTSFAQSEDEVFAVRSAVGAAREQFIRNAMTHGELLLLRGVGRGSPPVPGPLNLLDLANGVLSLGTVWSGSGLIGSAMEDMQSAEDQLAAGTIGQIEYEAAMRRGSERLTLGYKLMVSTAPNAQDAIARIDFVGNGLAGYYDTEAADRRAVKEAVLTQDQAFVNSFVRGRLQIIDNDLFEARIEFGLSTGAIDNADAADLRADLRLTGKADSLLDRLNTYERIRLAQQLGHINGADVVNLKAEVRSGKTPPRSVDLILDMYGLIQQYEELSGNSSRADSLRADLRNVSGSWACAQLTSTILPTINRYIEALHE